MANFGSGFPRKVFTPRTATLGALTMPTLPQQQPQQPQQSQQQQNTVTQLPPQQQQNTVAQSSVGNQQRAPRQNTASTQQAPLGPSIAQSLTSNDFCIPNPLPETPSPEDFFQFLDHSLSNAPNSWERLMPTHNRLMHYRHSRQKATSVPAGWTSDLAQYNWYVKNGLHIDKEQTVDCFGVLRQYIYSITNKGEKKEAPMLPFEYSYQIIASCHVEQKPQGVYTHLSRDKTYDRVSKITSTITKAVINGFIQHCPHATCARRRVKGKQHSADVVAKRERDESGPSTNRPPKKRRRGLQPQEQEQQQQSHFPNLQKGQFNNQGYQPLQLQQPYLPNVQMERFNNDHLFQSPQDIWSQIYESQQFNNVQIGQTSNEEYQPQQHQQPYFPNVPAIQNDIRDDDFADPQQPANVQMEHFNNGYPLQSHLIGQPGYEGYTESIRSQQQLANVQAGQNETIDPALLEPNSNYQEQPQEAAATGNAPVDQNNNGEEEFPLINIDATFEANPFPEFDFIPAQDWWGNSNESY